MTNETVERNSYLISFNFTREKRNTFINVNRIFIDIRKRVGSKLIFFFRSINRIDTNQHTNVVIDTVKKKTVIFFVQLLINYRCGESTESDPAFKHWKFYDNTDVSPFIFFIRRAGLI